MATPEQLRAKARRIYEQIRDNLLQTLQPGNARGFAHGTPRENLTHRSPYSQAAQGQSFQAGRMPSEAEITKYVEQQPAYQRAIASMHAANKRAGSGGGSEVSSPVGGYSPPAAAAPSASMGIYNNYLAGLTRDWEEAKAANIDRYNEGKGELAGTRDYRQNLYQNFGVAAQQDIDERMQENLSDIRSQAQRRGLSNSNVPLAFQGRAARDTAREQQRVRETRDTRLADAYAQDTGNLVNFIERREDPYPDMNPAMQIGIQLSEAEANRQAQAARLAAMQQGYRGTGGRGRSDVRLPPIPGPQGGVSPMFMNGTPVQMGNALFANYGPQRGVGSNRYPTRRPPQAYAPLPQPDALQADRDAWLSGRRVLPTYRPMPTYA